MQRFFERATLLVCIAGIGLNQTLNGIYSGFSYGASHICDYRYPTIYGGRISFWISDADPYIHITNFSIKITGALLIFFVVRLFAAKPVIGAISLLPLGACVFWWLMIHGIITSELGSSDKYVDAIRETLTLHWAVLGFLISLVVLQLISIGFLIHSGRRKFSP